MTLQEMHARNVTDVNARMAAEGRCVLHNPDVFEQAAFLVELPIGNVIPMSAACLDQWRKDRIDWDDEMMEPVKVTEIARR